MTDYEASCVRLTEEVIRLGRENSELRRELEIANLKGRKVELQRQLDLLREDGTSAGVEDNEL